jgi:hypothetical protein
MTRYLSISALQEPFDLGELDDSGREQCAFNVLCLKRPSDTFLDELVRILENAGLGKRGETIFAGSKAAIPRGTRPTDPPILSIKATGGTGPAGTHNDGAGAYRRPSAQVIARALTWAAAEAIAQAAYAALIAVRNQEVA